MAKAELMFGDGMVLRCDANFDLSKVMDVQPARLQGEDVTFSMHWDIPPETMQKFLDAIEARLASNPGSQVSDLEGE